jgi:ubiquitin-protein ligase
MERISESGKKRIIKEIMIAEKNRNCDESNGVFVYINPDDFDKSMFVCFGENNSPYRGFYIFNINYTYVDYPYRPPEISFRNPNSSVRFNPNLYNCGKICLSVLDTWGQSTWSQMIATNSLAITIRNETLAKEHPILNEPGLSGLKPFLNNSEDSLRSERYNVCVLYASLVYALVHQEKILDRFPEPVQEFIKRGIGKIDFDQIEKDFELLNKYDNQTLHSDQHDMFINLFGLKDSVREVITKYKS